MRDDSEWSWIKCPWPSTDVSRHRLKTMFVGARLIQLLQILEKETVESGSEPPMNQLRSAVFVPSDSCF